MHVYTRVHVARVSVDTEGEGGGGRWKADGSSTRPSTVSSRIALLPANVCHVWHTRRAPRGEHGRLRVPRGACESAGAHARSPRARFSRCAVSTHGVTYSANIMRRHTPYVALPRRMRDSDAYLARNARAADKPRDGKVEKNFEGQFLPSEETSVAPLAFISLREISICYFEI